MARTRSIKPEFFSDPDLVACSMAARLAFIGLWTQADREGRLKDDPRRLKLVLFPGDSVDMDALLEELAAHRFILRYEVEGQRYLQVRTFCHHQTPHIREAPSTLPAPGRHEASTGLAPVEHPRSGSGSGSGSRSSTPPPTPPSRGEERDRTEGENPEAEAWELWRGAFATHVGAEERLMASPTHWRHLRTICEVVPRPRLAEVIALFFTAPQFSGRRQLGMFAANAAQLLGWLVTNPGVPYGDEAAVQRRMLHAGVQHWIETGEVR